MSTRLLGGAVDQIGGCGTVVARKGMSVGSRVREGKLRPGDGLARDKESPVQ